MQGVEEKPICSNCKVELESDEFELCPDCQGVEECWREEYHFEKRRYRYPEDVD